MMSKAKVVWHDDGFNAFATGADMRRIIDAAAKDAARDLDSSLSHVRSVQRTHDASRGNTRELSTLSTSVESGEIETYKGKSRVVSDIHVKGLTVMDIMRQTVQRAVFAAMPSARLLIERGSRRAK